MTDAEKTGARDARQETADADTSHGAVLGTPGYMAPEQARGDIAVVGPRADVFALGRVLKFLLAGAGPTPKAVAAISAKAAAEDLQQRYKSAEELADEIARYLDDMPVSAYPETAITRAYRWVTRNRAWILLILAYLVMRAAFILWRAR